MGLHVAAGMPWRDFPVTQGAVVYVAAEGAFGITQRLAAWEHTHGVNVDSLPFAVIRHPAKMQDALDRARLIATIQQVADDMDAPVVWVILDTMARTFRGNENAPEDMGAYIAACDAIREATNGATVGVVHHFGHQADRGRGHSSWDGALDVALGFAEAGSGVKRRFVTCDKNHGGKPPKDLPPFPNLAYHLRHVVAETPHGPVDSVVAMQGDDPNATPEQTEKTDRAWNIVHAAITQTGPQYKSGLAKIMGGNYQAALQTVAVWQLDGLLVELPNGRLGLREVSGEQGEIQAD
jgi:hypothetical protein